MPPAKAVGSSKAATGPSGAKTGDKKAGGKKDGEVKAKPKSFKVQVHVIEVKDIKPLTSGLPDLVVTASVGKYGTKYTQVVRQCTAASFDMFLDWKFMATFEELKECKLTLKVLNANTDAKTEMLGMYELDLTAIRKQPLGEYFMPWLALYTDPNEYVTELCGALRATITCLGGAQQTPTHTEEEVQEATEDESPQVLMPHLVRWSHYSLFVAIYRVEGLPNMDDYGSTDAFVSVKLPGQAASKTKVMRNSLNPVFNELLRMPVQLPIMYDSITISVSDYDQGGYDSLVADTTFSLNDIIHVRKMELPPQWVPLYGIKGSIGLQELRETLPHVPLDTCYKGRLLLAIMAEEVSDRLAPKVKSIGPCADPPSEPYIIRFDLYQASQLDERSVPDNSQIVVELQVGGLTLTSSTGLAENGYVKWAEMFDEARVNLPCDLTQCPDIFINVNYTTTTAATSSRLGYIRLDLEDVCSGTGFNHAPDWGTLLRDPLYPEVSAVPGFLEYRLDFGKQINLPRSARERITLPPMRTFELRAHIYQARNLPSMDEDGLANPYAVVTLQGFAGQTRVAEPTCNPQWYETVRIELQLPQPTPISSQILVRVYDMEAGDTVGGDQLVGKCFVPLLGLDKAFPARPEWRPIWFDEPTDTRGEVLISFQLIAAEELGKVALNDITPPMRDVEVEVNVVGVREMLSYNNQPIVAPFVEVDAGDRSAPDKVCKTRPSSSPSGPDANFLETLVIHTRLPEDLLFCPALNVRVFDNRGPDNTPVIGKVAVPLAPYCEWIREAEYVPNNRPREPTYKISDEMSEASDDDEREVDEKYEAVRGVISADLHDANFHFMPEISLDTISAADARAQQRRGRTGRGQRVRTLPLTPPCVPYGLVSVEPDEAARIEKPLEAELEHLLVDPPFDEWDVYRGLGVGGGSGAARREVGRFKARLRVVEADLKSKALPRIDLADLFEQSVYISRVYVTRGIKLVGLDSDGLADPFLVIKNGRHKHNVIDDVKHVQPDTLNPNFYRCYELPTMLPGNPTLTIEVWDKDMQGAQLIGSTQIDIESRLLSQEWIELSPKPVERRYLWSPASLTPQGKLELWVEVLTPAQALATKPKVLRAPSALQTELRVVVWGVSELVVRDKSRQIQAAGNVADVFVSVQAGQLPPQESDIHRHVVDHASFNWRYLFDVQQPTRHTKLLVQVWDTHATSANDALAECVIQLSELYSNVQKAHRMHEVVRQMYTLTHPLYPGKQGTIDLSIALMPRHVAEELENIAGIGRGSPNQNPYLPAPNRAPQTAHSGALGGRIPSLFGRQAADADSQLGFNAALVGAKTGAKPPPPDAAAANAAANAASAKRGGWRRRGRSKAARGAAASAGTDEAHIDPRAAAAAAAAVSMAASTTGAGKRRSFLGRLAGRGSSRSSSVPGGGGGSSSYGPAVGSVSAAEVGPEGSLVNLPGVAARVAGAGGARGADII